jgi:hypothetical protein
MTFVPPGAQVPTSIPRISVVLTDRTATVDEFGQEQPASQAASYDLVLIDQNGQRIDWAGERGNLVPHLTAEEVVQAQAFMAMVRQRAETEILGG